MAERCKTLQAAVRLRRLVVTLWRALKGSSPTSPKPLPWAKPPMYRRDAPDDLRNPLAGHRRRGVSAAAPTLRIPRSSASSSKPEPQVSTDTFYQQTQGEKPECPRKRTAASCGGLILTRQQPSLDAGPGFIYSGQKLRVADYETSDNTGQFPLRILPGVLSASQLPSFTSPPKSRRLQSNCQRTPSRQGARGAPALPRHQSLDSSSRCDPRAPPRR